MRSAIHSRLVAAEVEEEFHIVDLATRRLTGQADRLMGQLPADRFSWEIQRSVVEANSRPWASLAELAEDIAGLRQAAIAAVEPLGLGIVAAGTVPLADPGTLQVTADPRYEHIRGEYRMLVREQLICSTQVHVDVDDRRMPGDQQYSSSTRPGWPGSGIIFWGPVGPVNRNPGAIDTIVTTYDAAGHILQEVPLIFLG